MSSVVFGAKDLAHGTKSPGRLTLLALGATILGLAFAAEQGATHQSPEPTRVGTTPAFTGPVVATALRAHRRIAASLTVPPTVREAATHTTGPGRLTNRRHLALAAALRGSGRHPVAHGAGHIAFAAGWAALEAIEPGPSRGRRAESPADVDDTGLTDLDPAVLPAANTFGAATPGLARVPDVASDLGRIQTLARAGVLNGQPAASVGLQYSLPDGIRVDAAGITDMASMADPGTIRKTFKVSTIASIPLD